MVRRTSCTTPTTAARWSAIAAQRRIHRELLDRGEVPRPGFLHRPIQLRSTIVEPATAITGPTRWSAAAAAFASLAMLAGALDPSPTLMVLLLVSVAAGAAVSMWVARRGGPRPLLLQAAIVTAIVGALIVIAVQATEVDGLLAALRGPLPDVLMLLVVLHGFEAVDRRTVRVHLAITFVLASYAAGLRIDATMGWWLAAWGAAFGASMLTTLRRPLCIPERDTVRSQLVPVRRPGLDSAKATGRRVVSIAAIVVGTLALLSLIPIPDGPARARLAGAVCGRTDRLVAWWVGAPRRLADDRRERCHRPRSGHGRRCRRLSGLHRGARHQRAGITRRRDRHAGSCPRACVLAGSDLHRVRRPDVDGLAGPRSAAQRPGDRRGADDRRRDRLERSEQRPRTDVLRRTGPPERGVRRPAAGAGDLRRGVVDATRRRPAFGRDPHRRLGVHGRLRTGAGRRRDPALTRRHRRVLRRVGRDVGLRRGPTIPRTARVDHPEDDRPSRRHCARRASRPTT